MCLGLTPLPEPEHEFGTQCKCEYDAKNEKNTYIDDECADYTHVYQPLTALAVSMRGLPCLGDVPRASSPNSPARLGIGGSRRAAIHTKKPVPPPSDDRGGVCGPCPFDFSPMVARATTLQAKANCYRTR